MLTISTNTFIIRKPDKLYCLKVVEALEETELALESEFAETREDLGFLGNDHWGKSKRMQVQEPEKERGDRQEETRRVLQKVEGRKTFEKRGGLIMPYALKAVKWDEDYEEVMAFTWTLVSFKITFSRARNKEGRLRS